MAQSSTLPLSLRMWLKQRESTLTNRPSMVRLNLHPKQRQIKAEARRFNVVDSGRRFGKTIMGQDLLLGPAQQGYPVGWFSPTYKMLIEPWQATKETARLITTRRSEQEHRIELMGDGVIEMWSLDTPDTARGRKYRRIVIDEAALVPDLEAVFHSIIRPMLADYRGDAWFFSTPKGRNGFYRFWERGQDPAQPEWKSWKFTTYDNPYIVREEIDAMHDEMPEMRFTQEILAEFVDDGGLVFRRVMDAATATPSRGDGQYAMGVDWGKHEDFTVITVVDVVNRAMVAMDRFNQIDYAVQTRRLKALAERYNPTVIIAERNSMGEPLIEQLQRDGLPVRPFLTTNATKAKVIEDLALAFERGELAILNDPILIGELQAYEMDRTPSGMVRYGAPPGMHDDAVISLALAWQACASGTYRQAKSYQG